MYRGILLTRTNSVVKVQDDFTDILREMERLRTEYKPGEIVSIDIYEGPKNIASLRVM